MTATAKQSNNPKQQREDRNSEVVVASVRKFQQLLKVLCDPTFRGGLIIEIHAKDGTLGELRSQLTEYTSPH